MASIARAFRARSAAASTAAADLHRERPPAIVQAVTAIVRAAKAR